VLALATLALTLASASAASRGPCFWQIGKSGQTYDREFALAPNG